MNTASAAMMRGSFISGKVQETPFFDLCDAEMASHRDQSDPPSTVRRQNSSLLGIWLYNPVQLRTLTDCLVADVQCMGMLCCFCLQAICLTRLLNYYRQLT